MYKRTNRRDLDQLKEYDGSLMHKFARPTDDLHSINVYKSLEFSELPDADLTNLGDWNVYLNRVQSQLPNSWRGKYTHDGRVFRVFGEFDRWKFSDSK